MSNTLQIYNCTEPEFPFIGTYKKTAPIVSGDIYFVEPAVAMFSISIAGC